MIVRDDAMIVIVAWISLKALMPPFDAAATAIRASIPTLPVADARAFAVASNVAVNAAWKFGEDNARDAAESLAVKATNGGGGALLGNRPRRRNGVCGGRKMIIRATGHPIPALFRLRGIP